MARIKPIKKKLRLQGFNNLTKSLSFNFYDVCYAKTPAERRAYLQYIDDVYNAERLTDILVECTRIIGANVLNIARQDYEPQGASVTILISEEPVATEEARPLAQAANGDSGTGLAVAPSTPEILLAHLDKSHICVHTYPEAHPEDGIATFRADIEVSTCGRISPLQALNYLIRQFDSDVMNIDYRVRGFTRDVSGKKYFIDHKIHTIQDFVAKEILRHYQAIDVNVYQENLFHTKLMWKKVDLDRYLFGGNEAKKLIPHGDRKMIKKRLKKEIEEIYMGCNIND
jgi:S-adenosylmethionine decarboxylase